MQWVYLLIWRFIFTSYHRILHQHTKLLQEHIKTSLCKNASFLSVEGDSVLFLFVEIDAHLMTAKKYQLHQSEHHSKWPDPDFSPVHSSWTNSIVSSIRIHIGAFRPGSIHFSQNGSDPYQTSFLCILTSLRWRERWSVVYYRSFKSQVSDHAAITQYDH